MDKNITAGCSTCNNYYAATMFKKDVDNCVRTAVSWCSKLSGFITVADCSHRKQAELKPVETHTEEI